MATVTMVGRATPCGMVGRLTGGARRSATRRRVNGRTAVVRVSPSASAASDNWASVSVYSRKRAEEAAAIADTNAQEEAWAKIEADSPGTRAAWEALHGNNSGERVLAKVSWQTMSGYARKQVEAAAAAGTDAAWAEIEVSQPGAREAYEKHIGLNGADNPNAGQVVTVATVEELDRRIAEAGSQLCVVDISTTWCGPCKVIYPKLVELAEELPQVVFLKINGDTSKDTAQRMKEWSVKSVPEFRFFREGKQIHQHSGANFTKLHDHVNEFK